MSSNSALLSDHVPGAVFAESTRGFVEARQDGSLALAPPDIFAIARERNYRALSLDDGLRAFETARAENLRTLGALSPEAWTRGGTQEGVGPVSLCDMPTFLH